MVFVVVDVAVSREIVEAAPGSVMVTSSVFGISSSIVEKAQSHFTQKY
jgi:hypothetical protein